MVGLFKSKAFSQAITVSGMAKTIYIADKMPLNSTGDLVGVGDLELQTKQALNNIATTSSTGRKNYHMLTLPDELSGRFEATNQGCSTTFFLGSDVF